MNVEVERMMIDNNLFFITDNLTFLYGITSYRRTNDSSNPIVYTKINRFLDWIEAAMTEME